MSISRKNVFAHLGDGKTAAEAADEPVVDNRPLLKKGNRSPAMGDVTKTLDGLQERNRRAAEIEKKLAEGQAVVDLSPEQVHPSFVRDRMSGDIDGLLLSIREQGQQVPILVRPHPEIHGEYQVAFGHRRLRALQELKLPVKAVVRDLTDEQLVVAQGQENSEREDLTFIEKARFAHNLNRQFSRDVVISAMSLHRSDVSKMLSIVDSLPAEFVDAIGPAPGIGRPAWLELVELFNTTNHAAALEWVTSDAVQAIPHQDRFKAVMTHLKPPRVARGANSVLAAPDGQRLAEYRNTKARLEIVVDKKGAADFAAFVLEKLPALYQEHRAANERSNGD